MLRFDLPAARLRWVEKFSRWSIAADFTWAAGWPVAAAAFAGVGIELSRAANAFLAEQEGRGALGVAHALRRLAEAAPRRRERLFQVLALGELLFARPRRFFGAAREHHEARADDQSVTH
jgi:hypothetical protein